MQLATQTIAQRAPPATRTAKSRWQPYLQPIASTSSTSLPMRSPFVKTPNSVQSPAPSISCEASSSRNCPSTIASQTPRESVQRDSSVKQKYAIGLIDQAVHTLADIWRPQDIPGCFLPPRSVQSQGKQYNLTVPSHPPSHPPSSTHVPHPTQKNITPTLIATGSESDQNITTLKTFVHEVLKRSRTSGTVLQTALCYLEAIRSKVPEILEQERNGIRAYFQPDSMIQPATAAEVEQDAVLTALEASVVVDESIKTVRVTDIGPEEVEGVQDISSPSTLCSEIFIESASQVLNLSLSLPSPLLCPRRTFLASLILASKFSQDKCYSNRAWAKLSGLPPREVGRCERALGQALDWRLWVGKTATSASTSCTAASRAIARSQSEDIVPSTHPSAFLVQEQQDRRQLATASVQTGLRRCSTAPEVTFRGQHIVPLASSSRITPTQDYPRVHTLPQSQCPEPSRPNNRNLSYDRTSSPSPETPGLSYSPSSSTSSGDQTIQMSTFEDSTFGSFNGSQIWIDGMDVRCAPSSVPHMTVENIDLRKSIGLSILQDQVMIVDPEATPCGVQYLWNSGSAFNLALESTKVS